MRVERSEFDAGDVLVDPIAGDEIDGARIREIAQVCEIRSFAQGEPLHGFRDQEVEVGISLAMAVSRQVHRQAIDRHGEVRAVIRIEAAYEVLRRLAAALVLRHHEPLNVIENLHGRLMGSQLIVVGSHLVGGCGGHRSARRHRHLAEIDSFGGCCTSGRFPGSFRWIFPLFRRCDRSQHQDGHG